MIVVYSATLEIKFKIQSLSLQLQVEYFPDCKYFPDCSCFGMALQESLAVEEGYKADYPTDDGGIYPDFFRAEASLAYARHITSTCNLEPEKIHSVYTLYTF